jgi:hypothetical protein
MNRPSTPCLAIALSAIALSAIATPGCKCAGDVPIGHRPDGSIARDGASPWMGGDRCGDGIDDDGDGRIDDGCPCGAGETQSCFGGAHAQRDIGICTDGTQTCTVAGAEWGDWGDAPCERDILPSEEICDGRDHDCDGAADDGCPCTAGETSPCGVEFLEGECRAGIQSCRPDGTWSGCDGAVGPRTEICDNGLDENCSGVADELCGCTPEPERCRDGEDNDCDGTIDEPACTPDWPPDAGLRADGGIPTGCEPLVPPTGEDWTIEATSLIPDGTGSSGVGFSEGYAAEDAHGNLFVAGTVCDGAATIAGVPVASGARVEGGNWNCNAFVIALARDRSVRYSWMPVSRELAVPPVPSAGPNVTVEAIAPDGAGGVWVAGEYRGRFSPGAGVEYEEHTAGIVYDIYVVHLDAAGDVVMERSIGERGTAEVAHDILLTGAGPVLYGRSHSPVIAVGSVLIRQMPDGHGHFLLGLDEASETPRWVTSLGGDDGDSWVNLFALHPPYLRPRLTLDPVTGNVVLPGYSQGNARLGPATTAGNSMWLWSVSPLDGSTSSLRTFRPGIEGSLNRARITDEGIGLSGDVSGALDVGTARIVGEDDHFLATEIGGTATARVVIPPSPRDDFHVVRAHTLWTTCLDAIVVARGYDGMAPVTSTDFDDGVVAVDQGTLHVAEYDRSGVLRSRRSVTTGLARDAWASLSPTERVVYAVDLGASLHDFRVRRLAF